MADGKLITEVERGDLSTLIKAGWRAPEPFKAVGRDGRTEIWGLIYRPTSFSPDRKYPVIENIYAGLVGLIGATASRLRGPAHE